MISWWNKRGKGRMFLLRERKEGNERGKGRKGNKATNT